MRRDSRADFAAVEALDLRDVTLVVHDWGGPIGTGAFLDAPKRVAHLTVINSTALARTVLLEEVPVLGEPAGGSRRRMVQARVRCTPAAGSLARRVSEQQAELSATNAPHIRHST